MRSYYYLSLMFFFVSYSSIAWSQVTIQSQPIRLGMIAPLSGDFAPYGEQIRKGIEIARVDLQEQGISTEVYYENACLPMEVRSALSKLIEKNEIQGLVGSYCVIGMVAGKKLLEDSKIISFQTSGGTDEILNPENYLFTTGARTKDEARKLAEVAITDLKLKKVAILYLQTQWGQEFSDSFASRFVELGGQITGTAANLIGESNFRNELARLRFGNPDGLLIAHLGGTLGTAIKQAKSFGFQDKQLLATSDAEDQSVINVAGDLANGLKFVSSEVFGNLVEVVDFESKFILKYNEKPSALAKHSFDATMIAVRALVGCHLDKVCAKDEVSQIQNYRGASGIFSFDADGGTTREFLLREVVGRSFR